MYNVEELMKVEQMLRSDDLDTNALGIQVWEAKFAYISKAYIEENKISLCYLKGLSSLVKKVAEDVNWKKGFYDQVFQGV